VLKTGVETVSDASHTRDGRLLVSIFDHTACTCRSKNILSSSCGLIIAISKTDSKPEIHILFKYFLYLSSTLVLDKILDKVAYSTSIKFDRHHASEPRDMGIDPIFVNLREIPTFRMNYVHNLCDNVAEEAMIVQHLKCRKTVGWQGLHTAAGRAHDAHLTRRLD